MQSSYKTYSTSKDFSNMQLITLPQYFSKELWVQRFYNERLTTTTLEWRERWYEGHKEDHILKDLVPWHLKRNLVCAKLLQSCPTLCDPMDCSLPGSLVHGILQARVLEWVAISFSRGSSWPGDRTWVSCLPGRRFNLWATREAPAATREPAGR